MKVVLDTNVLISGFITTTGPSQYVTTRAFKSHTVILSDSILKEFSDKLQKKLKIPRKKVLETVTFLKARAVILNPSTKSRGAFSDKKDIPILKLLQSVNANYFITGDRKLLALKKQASTVFFSPREGMEVL